MELKEVKVLGWMFAALALLLVAGTMAMVLSGPWPGYHMMGGGVGLAMALGAALLALTIIFLVMATLAALKDVVDR